MMMRGCSALLAALALAACSTASAEPRPRDVRPAEDVCERCHMTVDDPARAGEWVEPGGRVHTFDEAGCLLAWRAEHPDVPGAGLVADGGGRGWVGMEEAVYVRGGTGTTMGFGIVAYRDSASALTAARARGRAVKSFAALRREGVRDAHAH
jgi:hypothetical protein